MDPPTELPLNGTQEELAAGKINWVPGVGEGDDRGGGQVAGKNKGGRG